MERCWVSCWYADCGLGPCRCRDPRRFATHRETQSKITISCEAMLKPSHDKKMAGNAESAAALSATDKQLSFREGVKQGTLASGWRRRSQRMPCSLSTSLVLLFWLVSLTS